MSLSARPVSASAVLAVTTLATFLAIPVSRAEATAGFAQQGVHQHGKITLNLAVEGSDLAVELESPAVHVIGFERAPRTADEQAGVDAAAKWLRAGAGIVGVPASAGCVLRSAEVTLPDFGKPAGKDHGHDHGHDHDHAHDHDHDHGAHADYRARYRFTCRNPAALAWVEPWLLRRLRDVELAQVNVISPSGQQQLTAREAATRIPLR